MGPYLMQAAIVENGIVTNVLEVVQLSDWPGAIALPAGAGIGWLYSGGVFLPPPSPSVQQQAAVLLTQPVNIVCSSNSALDGTYSIDSETRNEITGVAAAINAGLGLPSGSATFNWPDVNIVAHPWPADKFILYAQAVMNYVYVLSQVAQGHGTTLPSQTLTIA